MSTDQPSATATIMAFHRALEMLYPEAGQVCQDPLAVKFLPPDWAGVFADREQLTALMGEKAKQFPGVNGAIVSRVRFIDDLDQLLRDRGFDVIENVNAPDLKARYFHGNGAQRPVTPVFWFAHAVAAGAPREPRP